MKFRRLTLCFALVALVGLASRSEAQTESRDALALLMKATGYNFVQVQDKDLYVVMFSPQKAEGVSSWMVRISYNNLNKSWVVIGCTMIDREDSTDFPERLKDQLLRYNSSVPGSKFSWDQPNGDIDVEWEIPKQFLTAELLRYMINDVAETCDEQYNRFVELLEP